MIVRTAVETDHGAIADVVRAAFDSQPEVSRLVERIRSSEHYVPELDLVAEVEGEVVGHVMLSYVHLGERVVLVLSPLAIAPAHQRRGIGTRLVDECVAGADRMGEPLVLVEGDPAYYSRFGFERASGWAIEPPPGVPDAPFQVKPLSSYDPFVRGACRYPAAFDEVL